MKTARKSIHDADALLLYQVGPVYCCSPTLSVESVMMPPRLTHPPGVTDSAPGVFKYASGIVHVVDLRKRFGIDESDIVHPGRIVVVEVEGGHAGIWVDDILDVIQFPTKGWGQVPAHIPRDVFSRTLLYDKKIMLYADFEDLYKFREAGYLRQHIESLKKDLQPKEDSGVPGVTATARSSSLNKKPPVDRSSMTADESAAHNVSSVMKTPEVNMDVHTGTTQHEKVTPNSIKARPQSVSHKSLQSPISQHKSKARTEVLRHYESPVSSVVSDVKQEASILAKKTVQPTHKKEQSHGITRSAHVFSGGADDAGHKKTEYPISDSTFTAGRNVHITEATESNMAVWMFALVLFAMLVVLYFNFEKFTGQDNQMPVIEDFKSYDASQMEADSVMVLPVQDVSEPVVEIQTGENSVVAESERSAEPVAQYRADIGHDKDDIVIVLQQPENDDVFKEEIKTEHAEQRFTYAKKPSGLPVETNVDDTEVSNKAIALIENNDTEVKSLELKQSGKGETATQKEETTDPIQNAIPESAVDSSPILSVKAEKGLLAVDESKSSVEKYAANKKIIHIVVKGDTLWHIAERYIKNPYRYPELAKLSKIKNPDLIYPGNKVVIIIEPRKNNKTR